MSNIIDLKKKNQRSLQSKKRLILKKTIDTENFFFYKELNKCKWFVESKIVASFISIKSEISTDSINKFLQKSNKVLCLPVIENNMNGGLVFKKYSKKDILIKGKFNIDEPLNTEIFIPDIIIAPCLAFDGQKVANVAHDNLDQKLDYILTEKQLYKIL